MNREEAIKVLDSRPYTGEVLEALETLIPELKESEDEKIRKYLIEELKTAKSVGELKFTIPQPTREECISFLEKQKDASKAIKAVERIDKYIDEHVANAHDMKDSDPDKKYYLGWDAALGKMAGILLDVYSGEKQKEQKPNPLYGSTEEYYREAYYDQPEKEQKSADEQFPPLEGLDAIKAKYYDDGFKNGFDEGVESVKPAEWDEYTKTNLGRALQIIKDAKGNLQGYQTDDGLYECDKAIECLEHFLYRGLEIEKPKQEWSEDYNEENIQTRFAFYTYKDEDGVLYLSNVFVEEASRNHGFGTKILIAAEKVAETIGATTISLKVKQDSPANAWYRKNGYGYVAFEDGYDWLEKNLEYMKPNKQEWSEEDEETLDGVINSLRRYKFQVPSEVVDKQILWLKSLRPQPKAELTLLDKNIISAAVAFVELNPYNYWCGIDKRTVIKALRSLRPSWKPSEEDIKMLEHIIGQYETGNKNSKVMGYLPRVEELSFLKNVLSKWKN